MWHSTPLRALMEIEFAGPDPTQKGVPLAPAEHQNGTGIGAIPYGNFPADFPYLDAGHRLTAMATAPPARPDTHLAHGRVLPSARQLKLPHSIGGTHHTYCILRSLRSPTGQLPPDTRTGAGSHNRLPAPVSRRDGHAGRSSPCTRSVTKAVQLDRVKLRTGPSGSAASRIATASPRSATSTHWPDSPQRVLRRHAGCSWGSSTWFLPPSVVSARRRTPPVILADRTGEGSGGRPAALGGVEQGVGALLDDPPGLGVAVCPGPEPLEDVVVLVEVAM